MRRDKILVVEDDPAVARSLCLALEREGYAVAQAATCAEALRLTDEDPPQLLLLDLRLPDGSGLDVCRRLRAEGHRLPIIMLTARDEESDKVVGLELGADDYVVKPYGLRELLSRIRSLLRRAYGELAAPADAASSLRFGPIEIDQQRLLVRRGGRPVDLTPIEFRLLRHLAAHPDRPFTRDALIEAIWGYAGEVGNPRTVDVHMRHLREKLEETPSEPRWLVTQRGVGYMLRSSAG
ncbi:MAG: response regulator transcription factor [Caldilineae bacterium]|nr:response regulator transcription factor [Chloroflexota bacterium]MCB9176079.1 response regulator transcription factor [Caldilineae bacterium]